MGMFGVMVLSGCKESKNNSPTNSNEGIQKSTSNSVTFQGVDYTPLENSTITNYGGDSLVISNESSPAKYAVQLGNNSGWHEDFKQLNLPKAKSLRVKRSNADGTSFGILKAKNVNNDEIKVRFKHALKEDSVKVVGYKNNTSVFTETVNIADSDGFGDVARALPEDDEGDGGLLGYGLICNFEVKTEDQKPHGDLKWEISWCLPGETKVETPSGNTYNDLDYIQVHVKNDDSLDLGNPKISIEETSISITSSKYLN